MKNLTLFAESYNKLRCCYHNDDSRVGKLCDTIEYLVSFSQSYDEWCCCKDDIPFGKLGDAIENLTLFAQSYDKHSCCYHNDDSRVGELSDNIRYLVSFSKRYNKRCCCHDCDTRFGGLGDAIKDLTLFSQSHDQRCCCHHDGHISICEVNDIVKNSNDVTEVQNHKGTKIPNVSIRSTVFVHCRLLFSVTGYVLSRYFGY